MQIESISLYYVGMPLVYPFRTAFGNDDAIESILVKICADGLVGWGEAAPWRNPAYSPESAAGCFLTAKKFLAPLLLGKNISSGEELQEIFACVKGNSFAKAGFDLAYWDLYAKSLNKPLWQVIGGKTPEIAAGADFGIMESFDLLLDTIEQAVAAKYKRVKLKYRPGWELDMLTAVRRRFPDLPIHVDCNSAYTLDDLDMLLELDNFNLEMIEQPLMYDDLIDHAVLQKRLKTPVCLDESITSPSKARKAAQIGACSYMNIKPGRVGGITNALKIHDIAERNNIPCWVGGMLESAVGAHFCMALATLPNIKYPSDIFPTERFFKRDLGLPEPAHSSPSHFTAPSVPGVGAEPDPEMLDRLKIAEEHFSAYGLK
ncbi:MAG: o-succinylbenzoate synthase [Victivallaceae bacterium]